MSPAPAGQPHGAPDAVFPLHAGARKAYAIVGVLCCLLVVGIPVAIWVFAARARGRLELSGRELVATFFVTKRWDLGRARRLGVLRVPLLARGIAASVARMKLGGDEGVHLCMIDERGKKSTLMLSTYERPQEIVERAVALTGLALEEVQSGAMGPRWPEPGR